MAGDWIKVEKATARKPEVLRLAALLDIPVDHAFGLCVRFWSWCDDQLADGHAPGVTVVTLDSVFGHAGFCDALLSVGWLVARNGSLSIPNFDRHLSESAKARALSGKRKQKQRGPKVSRSQRDKSVTREEKRREEKNVIHTPLPPFETESEPIGDHDAGTPAAKPAEWTRWRDDTLSYEANLIRTWNSLPGVAPYGLAALQSIHQRTLSERLKDPGWNWQEAMKRFPLNWGTGISPPSLPWFLKESSVADILGGKYARGSPGGGKPGQYDGLKAFVARGDT